MELMTVESTTEVKVETNLDRLNSKGSCLNGCGTPVEKMVHGKRVGIEFFKCPKCDSIVTTNSVRYSIPDPDKNRFGKVEWVV